ncbi:hypothetical protein [Streptomyces sp. NPDC060198]|uniref:hypothetical protein n=1 Tax=Streptomyces sp. NPDC060198 TaxID=3347070 RepID=UPI00365D42DE
MNVNRDAAARLPSRPSSWASGRWGTGVSAVVLVAGALVTGYLVFVAYMVEPDGSWDAQAVTNARVCAAMGLLLAVLLAAATWVPVRCAWLRTYWYAAPAALALAALLRLTLFSPVL